MLQRTRAGHAVKEAWTRTGDAGLAAAVSWKSEADRAASTTRQDATSPTTIERRADLGRRTQASGSGIRRSRIKRSCEKSA
jgi:hypothetical protein